MFFSVIIPTCNRNELLGKCLDRLAPGAQSLPASAYEVIVTDDGSGEGAERFCKAHYPWVSYTKGPRKGPAANRNNGATLAKNKWLVFLDDDCIPDNSLLKNYLEEINAHPQCQVFEGFIYATGKQSSFNQECPINETGGNLWSCNFCIGKNLFISLCGFDESFPYAAMEDIDFRNRINADNPIIFCRQARVAHPWKTIDYPFQRFNRAYLSHIIYFQKWPGERKRFSLYSQSKKLAYHIVHFLTPNLFRFKGSGITYVWAYYLFLLRIAFFKKK